MEKIYMEENQEPRRRQGLNFSVVLSFVVAFFAIFSLAVYGIVGNQKTGVSYAADPVVGTGETFEFKETTYVVKTNTDGFQVPIFYADTLESGNPIFCVEHNVGTMDDVTYRKDGVIEDNGLLYLLDATISTPAGVVDVDTSAANVRDVKAWIKQTAIWGYLHRKYNGASAVSKSNVVPNDPTITYGTEIDVHVLTSSELAAMQASSKLKRVQDAGYGASEDIYNGAALVGDLSSSDTSVVGTLVNNALAYSNSGKLSVKEKSQTLSLVEVGDKKYYQSDAIEVVANPSGQLDHYTVNLDGVAGAIAVDADGNTLPDSVSPTVKEFYVRVPEENIKEEEQSLVIEVVGVFNTLTGHYYDGVDTSSHTLQRVISVTGSTATVRAGTSITLVGAPDTGINTAQTIYFIGLIVLLCGVGIVYANAKPVEQKQQ